jgi:hypothetical protein
MAPRANSRTTALESALELSLQRSAIETEQLRSVRDAAAAATQLLERNTQDDLVHRHLARRDHSIGLVERYDTANVR